MTPVLQRFKQWLSISIFLSTALVVLVGMPSFVLADQPSLNNDRPPNTGNRAGGSRLWDGGSRNPKSAMPSLSENRDVSWMNY